VSKVSLSKSSASSRSMSLLGKSCGISSIFLRIRRSGGAPAVESAEDAAATAAARRSVTAVAIAIDCIIGILFFAFLLPFVGVAFVLESAMMKK
jgi:hypothetical protein